jgi:hypothetical protein
MPRATCLGCFWLLLVVSEAYLSSYPRLLASTKYSSSACQKTTSPLHASENSPDSLDQRKAEIQRKIADLKMAGKLPQQSSSDEDDDVDLDDLTGLDRLRAQRENLQKKPSAMEDYSSQLGDRLGNKAKYLGINAASGSTEKSKGQRKARVGSLGSDNGGDAGVNDYDEDEELLLDDDDADEEEDDELLDEAELVDIVAAKLRAKRQREQDEQEERRITKLKQLQMEREAAEEAAIANATGNLPPATTGIGGAYLKNATAIEETRRPSRGSWGYFERPKDISQAFGGGRRVGAGYMKEEDKDASYERTRQRMQEYRAKMGIDVPTETEHAKEIDEAIRIAKLAMERGVYGAAVTSLEKVTPWCSSNSKVGSQVYLELAMAYEAVGKSDEAIQIYQKLTTCRMEDVKNNAKRLLYGLESFEFMKSDAQLASFNRKKIRSTFIDTTGMDKFLMNFDDVYNTAYVDTSSKEYKRLTENVVRSVREARQILLKAVDSGLVKRTKIVQALRSVSRQFDEALREEKKADEEALQPVIMIDGQPIVAKPKKEEGRDSVAFSLLSPDQMVERLNGEWRLQLIADRTGDGVRFYNSTLSWQQVDTEGMEFATQGTVGFLTVSESGGLEFEGQKRILRRSSVESSGLFSSLLGPKAGATSSSVPQQIMTIDSILMVTRCTDVPKWQDEDKDHFAVWRRVEPGTFSSRV